MPLTPAQIDILNKLDAPNVRQRLQYAGAGSGSIVPGISSPDPLRIDVEEWLALKDREASKLQSDTLWYAKAAFWGTVVVGVAGIIVTIFAALLGSEQGGRYARCGSYRKIPLRSL
jgi:hypothetical protein